MAFAETLPDVPTIISPLIRIVPTGEDPKLARFATVIVTSRNAVDILGDRLSGLKVAAVGAATAARAREFGAVAAALGDTIERFVDCADQIEGPAIVCRGVHKRGNIIAVLAKYGIEAEECVLYDQVQQPLTDEAKAVLAKGHVVAPLFSPRTAAILSGEGPFEAELSVLAMSSAVADAWSGDGTVEIAAEPTADAMKRMTIRALGQ